MKTKEGDNVKLKALLAEAEERAGKIIADKMNALQARIEEQAGQLPPERRLELAEHERVALARVVGLGALKYADLARTGISTTSLAGKSCSPSTGIPRPMCRTLTSAFAPSFARRDRSGAGSRGEPNRTGGDCSRPQAARFRRLGLPGRRGISAPLPLPLPLRTGHALPQILRVVPVLNAADEVANHGLSSAILRHAPCARV